MTTAAFEKDGAGAAAPVLRAQPRPVVGKESVTRQVMARVASEPGLSDGARETIGRMLIERETRGIGKYGRTLETFNGRDAAVDTIEEFIDGAQYSTQLVLELEDLRRQAAELRPGVEAGLASERGRRLGAGRFLLAVLDALTVDSEPAVLAAVRAGRAVDTPALCFSLIEHTLRLQKQRQSLEVLVPVVRRSLALRAGEDVGGGWMDASGVCRVWEWDAGGEWVVLEEFVAGGCRLVE